MASGYTTEAVEAVIRFLMAEVGAGRVWSQHDVANPNSGEVMKKAGMDYEGTCVSPQEIIRGSWMLRFMPKSACGI